jgi:hypothetical protein
MTPRCVGERPAPSTENKGVPRRPQQRRQPRHPSRSSIPPPVRPTKFGHGGDTRWLTLRIRIASPFARSPGNGAQTAVWLAASLEVQDKAGKYFVDCREKEPSRAAKDTQAAQQLWQTSEALWPPEPHTVKGREDFAPYGRIFNAWPLSGDSPDMASRWPPPPLSSSRRLSLPLWAKRLPRPQRRPAAKRV